MSYETTLYVVKPYSISNSEGIPCGKIVAQIDMSEMGEASHLDRLITQRTKKARVGETPPFALPVEADSMLARLAAEGEVPEPIAARINDGHITEDRYDQWLTVLSMEETLAALVEDVQPDKPYRRFEWAFQLLTAIRNTTEKGDNFAVVACRH